MKKRAFDLLLSGTALIALSPVLVGIGLAVSINNGGPVIFRQPRVGQDGALFHITKFKTMNDNRDANGQLLPDSRRTTRFSRFLRKYGIDELPQIWDVFRGKMSMVGPRPQVPEGELSYFVPDGFMAIRSVKPGITGPVQLEKIQRQQNIPHAEKLPLDFGYATRPFSARHDLAIMWDTAVGLLRKGGNGSPLRYENTSAVLQAVEASPQPRYARCACSGRSPQGPRSPAAGRGSAPSPAAFRPMHPDP